MTCVQFTPMVFESTSTTYRLILCAVLVTGLGCVDLSESREEIALDVHWECDVSKEEIVYWKFFTRSDVDEFLRADPPTVGRKWVEGDQISIWTLKPTTFQRKRLVGEHWIVFKRQGLSNQSSTANVVVRVDEAQLSARVIDIACN